jgi:hypothetical protein
MCGCGAMDTHISVIAATAGRLLSRAEQMETGGMTIPDRDHPIWKLAQACVSGFCLIILIWHLHTGVHTGMDSKDVVGGALALKMAAELFGLKRA